MGTRERRQREISEREELFLDIAQDLIRRDGLLSLQMVRIAERSEYAVGTLYQHFASKEDLLLALTTRYVKAHVSLFQRVAAWRAGSRDRMFAIGVADVTFFGQCPDFFRVAQYTLSEVVWNATSLERRKTFFDANDPLSEVVISIVDDARQAGDLTLHEQNAQEISMATWSMCMGYHNFAHAEGVLEDFSVHDPYPLMFRHLQYLLNGFGWKPLFDPADHAALQALIQRIRKEVFDEPDGVNSI